MNRATYNSLAKGHPFLRFFQYFFIAMAIGLFSNVVMADKIDLNLADVETLQYIPGIGPSKSAEIIKFREQKGGFESIEQLLEVPGIGEKTLMEIKKHGAVNSGVSSLTPEMEANPPSNTVSKSKTVNETEDISG